MSSTVSIDRVLCVHADAQQRAALLDACDPGIDVDVDSVETGAEGLESLEDDDVGCLVFGADLGAMTPQEFVQGVVERDPDLPLLFAPESLSLDEILDVLEAGATGVIRQPEDDCSERVAEAIGTYRRRREQAAESQMLDALFGSLPVAMYIKDEEGRHVRLSDVPGGTDPEIAIGKTDRELYGEELAAEAYEDDMRVIENEARIVDKIEMNTWGGVPHWSATTKVPWYDDGEVRGLIGLTYDVTELKEREQRLKKRINRLEQFTSYVAHDLRTPLELADGHLELASGYLDDGDRPAAIEALDEATTALEQIDELIDDFQELAGDETVVTERGRRRSNDLAETVRTIWDQLRMDAGSLTVSIPASTTIRASQPHLRPLFGNLFKNAVEHAGPDVDVTVGTLDSGFYVEDDGPGIPEDERDIAFEAGYSTGVDGTGMGLSIVADVVAAHEWDLTVTESESGGARFEFTNCLSVTQPDLDVRPGESLPLTQNIDVGDPTTSGHATYDEVADRWTVHGAGDDIWQDRNEFQYVYAPDVGDVRIEGSIPSIEHVNDYSKAGLMVRGSLAEDAAYGFIGRTPEAGVELLWRTESGEPGVSQHTLPAEATIDRFRIDRVGEQLTCSVQRENGDWLPVDQRTVDLPETATVGLAVCSVVPRRLCEAQFADVSVKTLRPE